MEEKDFVLYGLAGFTAVVCGLRTWQLIRELRQCPTTPNIFTRLRTPDHIEKEYVRAGAVVGDNVSYGFMGEIVGLEEYVSSWAAWEREYSEKGFRTVSLDAFIRHGGYGEKIDHLLGQERRPEEQPVYHAEIFRREYLGKMTPTIDIQQAQDGTVQGTWTPPSTENPQADQAVQ